MLHHFLHTILLIEAENSSNKGITVVTHTDSCKLTNSQEVFHIEVKKSSSSLVEYCKAQSVLLQFSTAFFVYMYTK